MVIIIVTQGWVVNGVRRHAEPLGDNDPPQLSVDGNIFNQGEEGVSHTSRYILRKFRAKRVPRSMLHLENR